MENVGGVLALHWKVIIKFPTEVNGNQLKIVEEQVTLGETKDGKSFLELRIPQSMGSPLFPLSEISRSFELRVCRYEGALKPSIKDIEVTTFADEMPPFVETIHIEDALRGSKRLQLQNEGS